MKQLADEYRELAERLRKGGGQGKVHKQHEKGKLTARERITALMDEDGNWLEIGLLVAYDKYDGIAPAAGVVTGLGVISGREVVVVSCAAVLTEIVLIISKENRILMLILLVESSIARTHRRHKNIQSQKKVTG